jgi:transposase
MPYTSSLTDEEWDIIEPLLPKKKQTRPPKDRGLNKIRELDKGDRLAIT